MDRRAAAPPPDDPELRELHAFVLELGRMLSLAGAAVSETEDRLATVASANSVPEARVVVLPTALMIAFGRAGWATIESIPQSHGTLRLDQVAALYELVDEAERGTVETAEGLRRLQEIRAMPPRHGPAVSVLAYAAMAAGLCLVLQPTPGDVAVAAVLGAIVGAFLLAARGRAGLTILGPVLAATFVSAAGFEAVAQGWADPGLRALIAPLIVFLPGGVLTTATVELASGEVVAGASRLVSGSVQLLLLAFGIVAGAEIADLPIASAPSDAPANLLGAWAPWLGVVVFGVAVSVHSSAARGALPWLMLVLLTAWVGQRLGDQIVGADVSGFFGAFAMTPVALIVARLPSGPPPQVTFLPAFWLLVPGAVGLIGVTEVVGDPATASLEALVTPVGSIVSIALGVLCGVSVCRARLPRRWWVHHSRRAPEHGESG